MRWHHVTGLLFAGFVCAWIFSGLMAMNPLRIFEPQGQRPDLAAWQGGTPATRQLDVTPQQALSVLAAQGFHAVELEWRVLDGQPYLLARDGAARTRLLMRQDGQLLVREQWSGRPGLERHRHCDRLAAAAHEMACRNRKMGRRRTLKPT
ncbi:hypothetical protein [Janthinobacterium sp. PC23-8]|uniref:hypothetical protein n=1 Tax=Janthinobacterium sp. PC23-8 TaxID=2012679 RepID=UPI000B965F65|nr:hypothetical protein [Janthinobacterium sp. PC23-8]OYO28784.1 hypothetical protein CD932_16675 [Janthinobacterium sp. PC23-8]